MILNLKKLGLWGLILAYFTGLYGVVGCQKFEHNPNYWNVVKPRFVKCSCPCNMIVGDNRGECRQCGHLGNPNRGMIAKRVQASFDQSLFV